MRGYERRFGPLSNKRKHREGEDNASTTKPSGEVTAVNISTPTSSFRVAESTLHDNRLLAGYMAYEFLTKGTLLGEKFEPARAEAVPVQSAGKGSQRNEVGAEPNQGKANKLTNQRYAEVASLLKIEGTHIPGIINPTELARWIQL